MTSISHDLSHKPELQALAGVVAALNAGAQPLGIDYFMMGAGARDLMLWHVHGIAAQRQTEDMDFAVMVRDWAEFEALRSALLASGAFDARPGPATHRLRHKDGWPLDIVPFGGIERADRTIAWPPEHTEIYDCFGAREALAASAWVRLPYGVDLRVASIPALALLKVTAWHDRKHSHPGRDAVDLVLYLRSYMDCDNLDRASREYAELFDDDDFDYETAGVRLLARDLVQMLDRVAINRVLSILEPESDTEGSLLLARQSGLDIERAHRMIAVFCDELKSALRGNHQ